jgi:hypothetical protein
MTGAGGAERLAGVSHRGKAGPGWAGRSAGVRPKSAAAALRRRLPAAPGASPPPAARRRPARAAQSGPPAAQRLRGGDRPARGRRTALPLPPDPQDPHARRILGTSPGPAWPGLSLRLPLQWRPCGCWTLRLATAAHPDGDGCAQTPRRPAAPQGRRRAPERWRLDSSAPDTGTPGAGRRGGGLPRRTAPRKR